MCQMDETADNRDPKAAKHYAPSNSTRCNDLDCTAVAAVAVAVAADTILQGPTAQFPLPSRPVYYQHCHESKNHFKYQITVFKMKNLINYYIFDDILSYDCFVGACFFFPSSPPYILLL